MSIIYLTLFIIVNVYIHFSNGDDFSEYSAHLSQNDEYSLNWSVDSHQIWLNFSVCLNTNELNYRSNKNNYETDGRNQVKFFGLGFGRHDEPMNVDFYMLYFPILSKALKSDYEYLFMEGYTDENTVLQFRNSTESLLYEVKVHSRSHPGICFVFGRKAVSCRDNGYIINNQTTRVFLFHSLYEQLNPADEIKSYWLYQLTTSPSIFVRWYKNAVDPI
ncbi:unnamed protein product [Heterobilharzia americana]|nr:unnamed protein product [Heterobilharzia americana]